jgi:hypothetical protein
MRYHPENADMHAGAGKLLRLTEVRRVFGLKRNSPRKRCQGQFTAAAGGETFWTAAGSVDTILS